MGYCARNSIGVVVLAGLQQLQQQPEQGATTARIQYQQQQQLPVRGLLHAMYTTTPNGVTTTLLQNNVSSVDYMACCGAGHRTSKTADANYLAQRQLQGFALRVFWGYCDTSSSSALPDQGQTEVFQYV
jgi:hypothetical protein